MDFVKKFRLNYATKFRLNCAAKFHLDYDSKFRLDYVTEICLAHNKNGIFNTIIFLLVGKARIWLRFRCAIYRHSKMTRLHLSIRVILSLARAKMTRVILALWHVSFCCVNISHSEILTKFWPSQPAKIHHCNHGELTYFLALFWRG